MGVRAARNEPVPAREEGLGERARVAKDLALVGAPLGRRGLAEGHGLARDDVHERSPLHSGHDRPVQVAGVLGPAHHHAAARAAQCLVRGRGDEVRETDG